MKAMKIMKMVINQKNLILSGDFKDNTQVWNNLLKCATLSKLSIVGTGKHEFYPVGFSGFIILAESHIAIHTYPENNEAWLDIGTCDDGRSLDLFVKNIAKLYKISVYNVI